MTLPPQAPEAERAVLGALMIEQQAMTQVRLRLTVGDFYEDSHKKVYDAISALADSHPQGGIDVVTVASELRRRGRLEDVGGQAFLLDLTHAVATAAHIDYYAKEVKKASLNRQITYQLKATHEDRSAENLKKLGDLMYQLSAQDGDDLFDFNKDLGEMLDNIMADTEPGILTGFHQLDGKMLGWERGDVITIGGRVGLGKTAMMVRMLCNMAQAAKEGDNFLYITAEMKVDSIVKRILPMASGVPADRFKRKVFTKDEVRALVDATGDRLVPLPIKMLCKPFISIEDIKGAGMKAKARVIFVDYLQRCKKPRAENMAYAIEAFMAELKTVAQELRATIVLGVQLDRGLDRDRDRPPVLADLKGSSAIEAESDGVLLMWEPSFKYAQKTFGWVPADHGQTAIDCIIAKSRNSKVGNALLQMDKSLVKITDRLKPGEAQQEEMDIAKENH